MSQSYGQSSFKALLHNYGRCHKTHNVTRYEDQTAMYDDTEDMPVPHATASLDTTPTTHGIPDLDSETATG